MVYEKSFSQKLMIYCATHFRMVIALMTSTLIFISFCKALFILINPIVINGTVVDYNLKINGGGGRNGYSIIFPVIQFKYENKTFKISGKGTDHLFSKGDETKVILNRSYPNISYEYTSLWFIDTNIIAYTLSVGIILTGVLLAFRKIYRDNFSYD